MFGMLFLKPSGVLIDMKPTIFLLQERQINYLQLHKRGEPLDVVKHPRG